MPGSPPATPAAYPGGSNRSGRASASFPNPTQLGAIALIAVLLIAGLGYYFLRSQRPDPIPVSIPPGGPLAVVHAGPAVLAAQALRGSATGPTLALPNTPTSMVASADGSKAFLLDTDHGQVIPVDLAHGKVGAPIAAGKLPVSEKLSADGTTLYVTDNLGGAVIPIDAAAGAPRPAVQLAPGVDSYTPAPDGSSGVAGFYGPQGVPGTIAFRTPASGLGAPIEVGRNAAEEVVYSHDGGTAWVVEDGIGNDRGALIPVDVASRRVGAPIALGHTPSAVAVTPDGHLMAVTNSIDRTVTLVDLARRQVTGTVQVGAMPGTLQISADGTTAWVACYLDRTLVPVDLRSAKAGKAVGLAGSPSGVSLARSGRSAWVLYSSSSGNVTFLTAGNSLSTPIAVGDGPKLVIAQGATSAWVANALSDTVQRIDMSGRVAAAPIHVSRAPSALALTLDQRTLVVLSFGDGVGSGHLTAVDTLAGSAGTPLDIGPAPTALTLAPDGSTAYYANHQTNSIGSVDLRAWRADAPVALPCSPTALVITPDGSSLYAGCDASGLVVPINAKDHAVGAPIRVAARARLVMGNQGRMLYVNAAGGLEVIDTTTNRVVLGHAETNNIVGLVTTPDDTTLVAVENSGGAVLLIRSATLETTTSLSVGGRPESVRIAPDGSRAYVLDTSVQKLYVIDLAESKVISTVSVSPNAESIVTPARQP
ncbi:MAG: hypothetical protein ABR541_00030 [Candidatus Dormibacteria bacterium]